MWRRLQGSEKLAGTGRFFLVTWRRPDARGHAREASGSFWCLCDLANTLNTSQAVPFALIHCGPSLAAVQRACARPCSIAALTVQGKVDPTSLLPQNRNNLCWVRTLCNTH